MRRSRENDKHNVLFTEQLYDVDDRRSTISSGRKTLIRARSSRLSRQFKTPGTATSGNTIRERSGERYLINDEAISIISSWKRVFASSSLRSFVRFL